MIKSMTGFGAAKDFVSSYGRVNLEIRSNNHRFLDIVLHLPEGFLHLEQKIKAEIAKRVRRGHVVCRLEMNSFQLKKPVLNERLIKEYYYCLKRLGRQLNLSQNIDINLLAGMPGVWSMQVRQAASLGWPKIRPLVKVALDKFVQGRQQEGKALCSDLKARLRQINEILATVKIRFQKALVQGLKLRKQEDEKSSFLKSVDINEELVRLAFHLKNFERCLHGNRAAGKELDFILQEMQREANTMGAKSINARIASRVVSMKSEIEKMREQVQNVE